jgi:hypothetical protein
MGSDNIAVPVQGDVGVTSKETLDSLLQKNREYERTLKPSSNNHVPMVLIAMYRMDATTADMVRYFERFDLTPASRSGHSPSQITVDGWQTQLGQRTFQEYLEFFEGWIKRSSIDVVLRTSVPTLLKGVSTEAYHALLRLAYALDYNSDEEVAFSLAYWAANFYSSPDYDERETAVDADVFLAQIAQATPVLSVRQLRSIDERIRQIYECKDIAAVWKPIRMDDSEPLQQLASAILDVFTLTHHFTLLHALTSCQAMRTVLPYIQHRKEHLSQYWHSVCAAYLTVMHAGFAMSVDKGAVKTLEWPDIFRNAIASQQPISSFEHTIKLTYSCWREAKHYNAEQYRVLACRELDKASPFI